MMRTRRGKNVSARRARQAKNAAPRRAVVEMLEGRQLLTLTAAPAYLAPGAPGVEVTPLLTVADAVPNTDDPAAGATYRMAGIPDGLGAYDNNDGTFTVLMNHELRPTAGAVRAHGTRGAFVSQYIVDKRTLNVISGRDLIRTVRLFNRTTGTYETFNGSNPQLTPFNRFCSADLPDVTAFFNPATGNGTADRIYLNGEETADGRAFAHVATGPEAGTSYELPHLGRFAWENAVANPVSQERTIVMGLDDSSRLFTSEGAGFGAPGGAPSEVYVYVGAKRAAGNAAERAGLIGGSPFGVRVGVPGNYDVNELSVASGERFELAGLGDVSRQSAEELHNASVAAGVTQFRRVEDGHWDPENPSDFYYTTTDQFGGTTRVWRLRFDDVANPELGGRIEIVVDSPATVPGEMFDNMTVDEQGHMLLQEDPGGQDYLARIWQRDLNDASGALVEVARHNPALFDPVNTGSPSFITRDEESSGIIDLTNILGEGYYLADVQAHAPHPDPALVEFGQLLVINTNAIATPTLSANGVLTITGTINDDTIVVGRSGSSLDVFAGGRRIGRFADASVRSIVLDAGAGNDDVYVGGNVFQSAILRGGLGDDVVSAGGGRSIVIGDAGVDTLRGGSRDDIVVGGRVTLADAQLRTLLTQWAGTASYATRINQIRPTLLPAVQNDFAIDRIQGLGGQDWLFRTGNDRVMDRAGNEIVN